MNGLTDQQLLRDYAERRAEAAFGELVRRHVDLVYSAALRMVRDPHLAEDVTQGVFVALSRSAGQLTERPVLSGWLHRTAQNLAANVVRSDVRRRAREEEAAAMTELLAAQPDAPWEDIAPPLDAALGELSEPERDAVLLRYFERKSAREMAQTFGTSEEAAQKRVSRAVERLRELLAKRGVAAGAGGLVALISANAVQAAPAGLALSITAAATLAGAAVTTLTTATAAKTLAMTTLQKTLVAATLAAVIGVGTYEARQASRLRAQVAALQQQPRPLAAPSNDAALVSLQEEVTQLQVQNNQLAGALNQATAEKNRLETEREQARRSAALFKELADQAVAKDPNSTNEFPTARHLWVAWGRFGRLATQLSKDESKLSPEEKAANQAARTRLFEEMPKLMKAMKELDTDKPSGPDLKGEPVDNGACLLYGALNLDEQQFGQVYGLMQKYHQQAKEQNLVGDKAAPDAAAGLKQVMADLKADVQALLTPEQATIFEALLPHFQVSPKEWGFNFKF